MNIKQYQDSVASMPLYDDPILGLIGEVGEVVEHIKKSRRPAPKTKPIDIHEMELEIGDVLWYLTRLCVEYDIELSEVAVKNIVKLEKRHKL